MVGRGKKGEITMSLLEEKIVYKPFRYPWCYDAWLTQQRIHWLPEEVPLADDVKDWHNKLTPQERHTLTQIFRFFTQADIEVNNCYMKHYTKVFKPTEVQMMLAAFSNTETIHIAAYSYLLDTIGMPETEYQAFLRYKDMKDKYDYMQQFGTDTKPDIAKTLAVFGGFTEGLQLFASFAILLNFPRFNKMKGMGHIISWSVRDESLHTDSVIKLFRTFVAENPEIWTQDFQRELYVACTTVVDHEDAFVNLAFELGGIEGLTASDVKKDIRYSFSLRLDNSQAIAATAARYVALRGTPETINRIYDIYAQLTPEDIQQMARKYLTENNRTIVTLTGAAAGGAR